VFAAGFETGITAGFAAAGFTVFGSWAVNGFETGAAPGTAD